MPNEVKITVKADDRASGPMRRVGKNAKGLGGQMQKLGQRATGVAVGFVAAQVSIAGVQAIMSKSIGAAMAYEAQMAQIRALTGATEKDTDLLTGSIMDMAREMPKSPAELGAGAYFILSSGIEDAADAAEVLRVAARASTVGLGETQSVANALTTVLNAYGMSADKAGHVTDVMIEAVKQGKAEAGEFAGVLGRVVPLAAQMGINFEEVAANLATFTRLGVSADEAATGLRQVMASLLKPTKQSEEAMEELGFTAEGLRQQIREKGLLATLDDMTQATGGNEAAVAKLFPNIRALTSVLGTAGVQMDAYTDILGATNNATGNLDEGFKIVSATTQFKVKMAMQELNLALMDVGEVALPLVAEAAGVASDAVTVLATAIRVAKGDLDALDDSAKDASLGLLKLGTDIGTIFSQQVRDVVGPVNLARDAFKAVFGSGGDVPQAFEASQHEIESMKQAAAAMADAIAETASPAQYLSAAIDSLTASLKGAVAAQSEMISLLSDITSQRTQETNALDIQINALELERNAALQSEIGQESLGGAVGSTTDALGRQVGALNNLAASMVPQALNNEITALGRELKVLELGKLQIEAQINARNRLATAQLAMANIANLPAMLELKKLELKREELLAAQSAKTLKLEKERARLHAKDDLSDAGKKRLKAIDAFLAKQKAAVKQIDDEMDALSRGIHIKTLEAEITNLQAEASDKNREAMQRELTKITDQIGATSDLKRKRELYIETLVPVQLLQDIDALGRQKTALDNSKTGAQGAAGATRTLSDTIGDQVKKLGLQREAIDLVTKGWELQAKAMLGLPKQEDMRKQLLALKALVTMSTMQSMLSAMSRGDFGAVAGLTKILTQAAAFQPAQHGFIGEVTKPTMFLAGEGGRREGVQVTPGGLPSGGARQPIQIIFQGPILGDHRTAMQFAEMIKPELERLLT